ncbi:MAG: phosphoribosyltransferase, partial [Gemmatimonadaceae bacterium]
MIFRDRVDAGRQLARALAARIPSLPAEDPIVLAIPRGGVPVGFELARDLGAPLDVFVARKLGA